MFDTEEVSAADKQKLLSFSVSIMSGDLVLDFVVCNVLLTGCYQFLKATVFK